MIEKLEVVPGPGTVMRYGAIVAWADASASSELISFLAQSARNLAGSARGGRQVADHIAAVLRDRDPEPRVAFAVVGPDGAGWASLLHGPVQAWDGQRWLAPTPSPGWLQDVLAPRPSVTINAAGQHTPVVHPDSLWDLETGVVPGSGFVLFPTTDRSRRQPGEAALDSSRDGAGSHETAVLPASPPTELLEAAAIDRESVSGSAPETVMNLEPEPPKDSDLQAAVAANLVPGPPGSIDLRRALPSHREPLPVGLGPDRLLPGVPVVAGVICERGHLNRPGMPVCIQCAMSLPEATPYAVSGSRPGLGCLVADDGTVWGLDRGYLVGSNPVDDPTVRGGVARPLLFDTDDVAAAHAEIRLKDWDVEVIDRGSHSGTFVFETGGSSWVRVAPFEPKVVEPGSHLSFGQRIVTYVTPWVPGLRPAPTTSAGS